MSCPTCNLYSNFTSIGEKCGCIVSLGVLEGRVIGHIMLLTIIEAKLMAVEIFEKFTDDDNRCQKRA